MAPEPGSNVVALHGITLPPLTADEEQTREDRERARAHVVADSLRTIAAFIEEHPEFALSTKAAVVDRWVHSRAELAEALKAFAGVNVERREWDGMVVYRFDPAGAGYGIEVNCSKEHLGRFVFDEPLIG